jgi:hypothetical protein
VKLAIVPNDDHEERHKEGFFSIGDKFNFESEKLNQNRFRKLLHCKL